MFGIILNHQIYSLLWNKFKPNSVWQAQDTPWKLYDPKKVNWKLNFIGVPYNQTFDFCHRTVCEDFDAGLFVKILTPACLWRFVKNVDKS